MASAQMAKTWWTLALALTLLAVWTVQPFGAQPPRSVETDFDTDRALDRLTDILGDERPHPVDSDAGDAVRGRLVGQIEALGFRPLLREAFHCSDHWKSAAICARVRNVAFWVSEPGDDAVMLSAHYDSVPAGPGAADDGIGIAVALEIAALQRGRDTGRPLLVVLTDGEEAGLLGADAFAARDPLAKLVGSVVNLEARGTSGPANMFETSTPNGRDVAALEGSRVFATSSSLATDLYHLMPNDTDLSVLLPLGIDAANFSIIGSSAQYHTPLDNLANLDRSSVRHLGSSALAAVRGFSAQARGDGDGSVVFADFWHRVLLAVPVGVALVVLLGGLAAAVLLYRSGPDERRWRALLVPPIAIIAGVLCAVVAAIALAALRAETAFATAQPVPLRICLAASALGGTSVVLWWARPLEGPTLAAGAWAWFLGLILAAFAWVPGFAALAVWPAVAVIAAGAAALIPALHRAIPAVLGLAALVFAAFALPAATGAEDALLPENSAPLTLLLVLSFLFLMPAAGRRFALVPALCGVVTLTAGAAALAVPAFSPEAPRHLSVVHEDSGKTVAFLIDGNGPIPAEMSERAEFAPTRNADGFWHAPAPALERRGGITVISDKTSGTLRTVRFRADAPLADRQEFYVEEGDGAGVRRVFVNGALANISEDLSYIGCSGRSCRSLDITLVLSASAKVPPMKWQRHFYGAGDVATPLVAARPADGQPVHIGDRRTIVRSLDWVATSR